MRISTDDIILKKARYGPSFDLKSGPFPNGFIDSWNKQKKPSACDLLREYERIGYTCANLNVDGVLNAKLRLYTFRGKSRNKTAPVDHTIRRKLIGNPSLKLHLASESEIEEITDHQFLDLWHDPNPLQDAVEWLGLQQTYREVIGHAYIQFIPNRLGLLQEWWVLPSHEVTPVKDTTTNELIGFKFDGKEYPLAPNGTEPYIKAFCNRNPHDPYGGVGISPLAAAFESINLESKMMATEAAILDNEGRPSGILSPDEPIGDAEAKRWEHRFNAKFRQAGSGNVLVSEEKVNFTPLTFPPKDLAALQVAHATKVDVCGAFGIPVALLEGNQFNRATLEASILLHVRQAIWPRLRDLEAKLNKHVVSLYGKDLFVAFDDPSPESKDLQATYLRTLVDGGILLPNEARLEMDHKPVDGGDTLRGLPGSFEVGGSSAPVTDDTEAADIPQGEVPLEGENIQQQALNGAQITSLVEIASQVAEGLLPLATGEAIIAASFPSLTAAQIEAIVRPLADFEKPVEEPPPSPIITDPTQEPEETEEAKSLVVFDSKLQAFRETLKDFGLDTKAVDRRWKEPPYSPELEKVLAKFFAKYRASALQQAKKDLSANLVRKKFVPLDQARDELVKDARPIIEIFLTNGGKELMQRVGLDPDVWAVTNPKVRRAVEKAAFAFADSTNQSTTMKLNDALEALRSELGEGLSSGERLHKITAKVNDIFDGLEKSHAKLIAQTEASRAHHEGLREAAKESGVVKGFELLLSPDACPQCQRVFDSNKRIGLDGHFVEGEGTYGNRLVPIHPGCRCAMLEVLDIQA